MNPAQSAVSGLVYKEIQGPRYLIGKTTFGIELVHRVCCGVLSELPAMLACFPSDSDGTVVPLPGSECLSQFGLNSLDL
jgi:hypothetical protein